MAAGRVESDSDVDGIGQLIARLNNYIKDVFIEQLHMAVSELLDEKRRYKHTNSSSFKVNTFVTIPKVPGLKWLRQSYAKSVSDPKKYTVGEDPNDCVLMKTLKEMAFDKDFACLIVPLSNFGSKINTYFDPKIVASEENFYTKVKELAGAFHRDSVVGQRFQVLGDILLPEMLKFSDHLQFLKQLVTKSDKKLEGVAAAIQLTPTKKLSAANLEQEIIERFPGYRPLTTDAPEHAEAAPGVNNSGKRSSVNFQANVLGDSKRHTAILDIIGDPLFNEKHDRGYQGGIFSKMYRSLKKALGFRVESRLSVLAEGVRNALSEAEILNPSGAIRQFRMYWLKQKSLSSKQRALLRQLAAYETLLSSEHIAAGVPMINQVAAKLADDSERSVAQVKAIKRSLSFSYDVSERSFLRNKSFAEVALECQASSKRNIVPMPSELDQRDSAYIGKLVLSAAKSACRQADHGLVLNSDGSLSSSDVNYNAFLIDIQCRDLSNSQRYFLLLSSLAIRGTDNKGAENIKQACFVEDSRERIKKHGLVSGLRSCKSFPDALKAYLPISRSIFVPNHSECGLMLQLSGRANSIRPSICSVVDRDVSADLRKPKTAEEIEAFSYDELQLYAQAVCHEVVAKPFFASPKLNIHPFIERYFVVQESALRPGHKMLKFLLAMLEWYGQYKRDGLAGSRKVGDDFAKANALISDINMVCIRIKNYLQGIDEAINPNGISYLNLGELLKGDVKREPGDSFNKLLTFVAHDDYCDEAGHPLPACDLGTQFAEDSRVREEARILARAATRSAQPDGVFSSFMTTFSFGAKKMAAAAEEVRRSSIGGDDSSPANRDTYLRIPTGWHQG